ncbi:MAG: Asp-tRNA(Asn)/Glu-tRNA(Gln) amidotransferase subunit GatC [Phycisphaerae bacterium]
MPPSLDESAVRHVANLARLNVSDAEVARYAAQLSAVLAYFEQLKQLDTTDVPPTAHPLPLTNVFRDDLVGPTCTPEFALRNAPSTRDTFFRVPKVLDHDGA